MRSAMPLASAATRGSPAERGRGRSTTSSWRMRPGRVPISTTRSARRTASRTLWVTKTMVLPRGAPDALDLALQDLPRLRVERREGLVHEQHGGIGRQRARDGPALAHAARELVGIAVVEAPEVHEPQQLLARAPPVAAAPSPWSLSGNSTLSRRVSHGKSAASWKTTRPVGPGAGDAAPRSAARDPTWASPDRRRGSGWWTCRCRTDRAGRRTRRPRRAARPRGGSRSPRRDSRHSARHLRAEIDEPARAHGAADTGG